MTHAPDSLAQACSNLTNQFNHRYGARLFRSSCGEPEKYATELSACFKRTGLTGAEISSLQGWLVTGIKAFAEYPPSFEMMVQMGKLLRNFPITPAQRELYDFWLKLDTLFIQNYGRLWKIDGTLDQLQKERVWLTTLEEMGASLEELQLCLNKIKFCVAFRSYPPNLEQFKDALIALRSSNAPLVEDAWLQAIALKNNQELHPLVRRARGAIGAFDLNVGERDRATEQRFKLIYIELLRNPPQESERLAPEGKSQAPQYVNPEDILHGL